MELTIEYAVKDYEIKTSNENKENLEQILKVFFKIIFTRIYFLLHSVYLE